MGALASLDKTEEAGRDPVLSWILALTSAMVSFGRASHVMVSPAKVCTSARSQLQLLWRLLAKRAALLDLAPFAASGRKCTVSRSMLYTRRSPQLSTRRHGEA